MPAQPWQPAIPQQQAGVEEQAAYDFTYQNNQQPFETEQGLMYPPVPEAQQPQQPMPPQEPQLVAGIGHTGPSVMDQVNAWGTQQLYWNRQYSQSQQNQAQLRMVLFNNSVNPDVGSLMTSLQPVLPQIDPVVNARLHAEHERDRFEQAERENVRLRGVIDALKNAQPHSRMPLDPALAQSSPFAQQPRTQQPFVQQLLVQQPLVQQPFAQQAFAQQSPHQQTTFQQGGLQMTEFQQSFHQPLTQDTSQPAQPPANPFAPMGLDVRAGQPQAFTGNMNQGNPAPTQRPGDGFTLGRTRLHGPRHRHMMPSPTTSQPGLATTGATATSPVTATQATTTKAPAGQNVSAATSTRTSMRTTATRTRSSARNPPASRTVTGRVTKPRNKPPAAKETQQQETSIRKKLSLKELKRRRKELKEMQASGELYREDTDIPADIMLLFDPEGYAGQEVTSGSEEGLDSGAAAVSAVASGTGTGTDTGTNNNAQAFSNVAPQNTGFTTGTPNTNYNTASFANTGLQIPGFVTGNNNYSIGSYTNTGLQDPAPVPGNNFNLYNPGDFTNMEVEDPLFVPRTDNSNAYITSQQTNVNPQASQYTNMEIDPTIYPQNVFNAGDDDFMGMLGDDSAGMFNYDDDMDLYGASDREAEPQPPQGDELDIGDWLNSSS